MPHAEFRPDAPIEVGTPVAISPLVRRLTAPNPGMMTGPGTNSYLVGTEEIVVIDPGPDDAGHLDAIAAAGAGRIRWILATHTHSDHSPGCAGLRERTGATVVGFEARERERFTPDEVAGDGWSCPVDGGADRLVAMHTPGHASNHLCFLLAGERLLFTGDHIMGGSTVVIGPPDGDMAAYLESLARLGALDPPLSALAPGHGTVMPDPAGVIAGYVAHRLAREAKVAQALNEAGRATIEDLLATVYADTPPALHPVARYSLWAHLRKLVGDGRVAADDVDDLKTTWSTAGAGAGD